MTTVYIEKNANGVITSLFGCDQPGLGLIPIEASDPAVQAFMNPQLSAVQSVSARQFKLQLLSAGLLDAVNAWVSQQSRAVQIAYEYSGTFVKDSPMMTGGFAAMGFSPQQIDDFFAAAAEL
ncbi:hypothetical protein HFO28_07835 [Rhizobium leguminosarum]|uniref:hypothetical protein n=1 Tax=Rhizobium leguminosarum TaxID=384 RepID=UPI001C97BA8F|nr:hypothetical protein [Rhizobium leguminosarum]MBY5743502.1 hypothetical protein [Rhizobium leguminosarum]